jgi:hypothetical protein
MVNKLRSSKTETSKGRVELGKLVGEKAKNLSPQQAKKIRGGRARRTQVTPVALLHRSDKTTRCCEHISRGNSVKERPAITL